MMKLNECEMMMVACIALMLSGILVFQVGMRIVETIGRRTLTGMAVILTLVGGGGAEFFRQLQRGEIQLGLILVVTVICTCFCMTIWLVMRYRYTSKKREQKIRYSIIEERKSHRKKMTTK